MCLSGAALRCSSANDSPWSGTWLTGINTSLTTKPMNPIMAKPIAVLDAILLYSRLQGQGSLAGAEPTRGTPQSATHPTHKRSQMTLRRTQRASGPPPAPAGRWQQRSMCAGLGGPGDAQRSGPRGSWQSPVGLDALAKEHRAVLHELLGGLNNDVHLPRSGPTRLFAGDKSPHPPWTQCRSAALSAP